MCRRTRRRRRPVQPRSQRRSRRHRRPPLMETKAPPPPPPDALVRAAAPPRPPPPPAVHVGQPVSPNSEDSTPPPAPPPKARPPPGDFSHWQQCPQCRRWQAAVDPGPGMEEQPEQRGSARSDATNLTHASHVAGQPADNADPFVDTGVIPRVGDQFRSHRHHDPGLEYRLQLMELEIERCYYMIEDIRSGAGSSASSHHVPSPSQAKLGEWRVEAIASGTLSTMSSTLGCAASEW